MPDSNAILELELTYLAKELPVEIQGVTPARMEDTYIPEHAAHAHLRVRAKSDRHEITKKLPVHDDDASVQVEQTIPLTPEEYRGLSAINNRKIIKDRYNVVIDGHAAEVDIFHGKHEGLVLIDFEFETAGAKAAFTPPACCLADVTQEEFIAGGVLSAKSYDDIAGQLELFGYRPLSAE
jgi:CYTH domain-containing protein